MQIIVDAKACADGTKCLLYINGELIVNYKPKIDFWEFMTLFGSVFGLWFGVHGLQLGHVLFNSVITAYHRFASG